jgi:hypothetical protein
MMEDLKGLALMAWYLLGPTVLYCLLSFLF